MTIIMGLTTALTAVAAWGVKKDRDLTRSYRERLEAAEKRTARLEGLLETRHGEEP